MGTLTLLLMKLVLEKLAASVDVNSTAPPFPPAILSRTVQAVRVMDALSEAQMAPPPSAEAVPVALFWETYNGDTKHW